MLSMVSFTMTSCQDFWGDVLDSPVEDNTTDDKDKEEEEKKDDVTVTFTENGAELTVQSLSDVTTLLAQDDVKADIEKKAGEEYIIEIKGEGLTTTSEDNTISVPKVEGSNINLTFSDGITTEEPLVVTAAERKSETSVEAVDAITITVPASDGLKLEIDMPETSVTLAAESGSVTFDEVISTTATKALYLESGVTVENLQVEDGTVVVMNGAEVDTYVYAPKSNDVTLEVGSENFYFDSPEPELRADANVTNLNGKPYVCKNWKIVKGEADYANVDFYGGDNPIEKLTIAEGAVVKSINNEPRVKLIEGEKGARLIFTSTSLADRWLGGKPFPAMYVYLTTVAKISGVSVEAEIPNENWVSDWLASYDESLILDIEQAPSNMENCVFKAEYIAFREGDTSTGTVTNCTFEASQKDNVVYIQVPAQTTDIPSYRFSFEECSFSEGFKLNTNITDYEYEYDDNGNIIKIIDSWWWVDSDWNRHDVNSKEDIPDEGVMDSGYYWHPKTKGAEFNDYYVTIAFTDCKIGSSALTKDSDFINFDNGAPDGAYLRYEIDGTTYMKVRDEKDNWFLVEAPKK